ncbi:lytic murein transglycosylase [Mesorhizobium sp. M00.F.Ca.ET.216.01.1.1]|nr:lytic murein transglycosylase [Mesorhizobium sp. M00.F.Ca.ET.216.01.1.1]
MSRVALYGAPLWPAGHLKGGDQMSVLLSPIINAGERREASKLPSSPLEGEMAGRPEGGAVAPTLQSGGILWAR